ncbi:MAG: S1 family peptidase [Nitrosomonas sp.]|nr:S1 family peptidase [Nitrosomonas sp.]
MMKILSKLIIVPALIEDATVARMKQCCCNALLKLCLVILSIGTFTARAATTETSDIILDPIERAAHAISLDLGFATLNRLVPSFGGLYLDEKGNVIVALTDSSKEEEALPFIKRYLEARAEANGTADENPIIVFKSAKRTWFELLDYRDKLAEVMTLLDAASLDADEVCNCVTIGVTTKEGMSRAEKYIAKIGVPNGAVRVVQHQEAEFYHSLRDVFRPFEGGIQMSFWESIGVFPGVTPNACTVTAVAKRAGVMGFLTNSHCTNAGTGGALGTPLHQPSLISLASATDTVNPAWIPSLPNCPPGRLCRFSDSAFAAFNDPADGNGLGNIALPTRACSTPPCGPTMDYWGAQLVVDRAGPAPLVGTVVNKIGRTTGYTSGAVTNSCVTMPVRDTIQTLLCQDMTNFDSQPGDSGSPVFIEMGMARVALVGIAWGGFQNAVPPVSVYSPIGAVQAELGTLDIAVTPPVSSPPPQRGYCDRALNACLTEATTSHEANLCKWEDRACRKSGLP